MRERQLSIVDHLLGDPAHLGAPVLSLAPRTWPSAKKKGGRNLWDSAAFLVGVEGIEPSASTV
jgi:hypothetical protein